MRRVDLNNNEPALMDTKRIVILFGILDSQGETLVKTLRSIQKTPLMRTMSPHAVGSLGLEDMVNRDAMSQDHIMTQDPDVVLPMNTVDQDLR